MKKVLLGFSSIVEIIKIIIKYEPFYIAWTLPQIIIKSIIPILYVYFPKLIIEQLIEGDIYLQIVKVIIIYSAILLVINSISSFLQSKCSFWTERFSLKLKNEVGDLTMQLKLKDIESASNQDVITLANNATELTSSITLFQNIVSNIMTIAGLTYMIIKLDYIFIILVGLTLCLKIIFVKIQYKSRLKQRLSFAKNDRIGNYVTDLQYFNAGGAKEIRINNIQNWFMGKITNWRNEMVSLQQMDFKLNTLFQILTAIISALQFLVILSILAKRYSAGIISIADFTMYFSAVTAVTACLSSITEQISDFNRQLINLSDLKKLMLLKHENETQIAFNDFQTQDNIKIEFVDVYFLYPSNNSIILKNINLTIQNREKLVIVGLNGAGKSTLIKLLCKFYRPTRGIIKLNNIDIWDIPNDKYYKIISTVFQDFSNLAFSIKESISMTENSETEHVKKALTEAGLNKYINSLPMGLDTYITRQFDNNGTELSGGQDQKLAIARAIYKDTPILILDEPTASLDPKAESEIYTHFFNIAKDKTTIFISHRLAASTIADKIAVLSNGEIVECGKHTDLIKLNGIYAEMFKKQSKSYVDEKSIF